MPHSARNLTFFVLLTLFVAGGANCRPLIRNQPNIPPQLPPNPSLEQIIEVVNRNSMSIQSFTTDHAKIKASGSPTLPATIAMQRPGRFRMRADTALSAGPELDLGSNDREFWFWHCGDPENLYVCRHDEFAAVANTLAIPLAPAEVIDAMGLATIDPALPHQQPQVRADGMLVIRTIRESIDGPITKTTVVHPYGWIVEQHFQDAQGQTVLSTTASRHRRDPATGLIMPQVVDINCPPSGFRMRVTLGPVEINTLPPDAVALWNKPHFQQAREVDLSDPNLQIQQQSRALRRQTLQARRARERVGR